MEPTDRSAVCDPFVTSTTSSDSISTTVASPSRTYSMALTVIRPGDGANAMRRTNVPVRKLTPCRCNHFTRGSTIASY